MIRLLHAAARGARIQWQDSSSAWKDAHHVWPRITAPYRIHPDDEHLQYGPISVALREAADTGLWRVDAHIGYWSCPVLTAIMELQVGYHVDSELHRSLFLLILSEALADEGL